MSLASPDVATVGGGKRWVRAALIAVAFLYIGILVLAPTIAIVWRVIAEGWTNVTATMSLPDVRHAYWLTIIITIITVIVTGIFGVIVAWVLTRDRFIGRSFMNALVDLPLAVSPVIVGLAAVLLFGRGGWFEPFFAEQGIQFIFALPSMIVVTIFICVPFVIREVAPILKELGTNEEEAAATLGASPWQSFRRVTLPNIRWGLLYGIALSTARSLGEIGAVLIVSGAIQGQTETSTLFILRALEERQEPAGFLVALSLAAVSILMLVIIEFVKRLHEKRET